MFEAFDASASALRSERVRLNIIANNLANVYTTRNEFGERVPFRRRLAVFMPGNEENSNPDLGVSVESIVKDDAQPRLVFDPTHPDRIRAEDLFEVDEKGVATTTRRAKCTKMPDEDFQHEMRKINYVEYPNVDPVMEMNDAIQATRSYEASVAAIEASKGLIMESLSIIA